MLQQTNHGNERHANIFFTEYLCIRLYFSHIYCNCFNLWLITCFGLLYSSLRNRKPGKRLSRSAISLVFENIPDIKDVDDLGKQNSFNSMLAIIFFLIRWKNTNFSVLFCSWLALRFVYCRNEQVGLEKLCIYSEARYSDMDHSWLQKNSSISL